MAKVGCLRDVFVYICDWAEQQSSHNDKRIESHKMAENKLRNGIHCVEFTIKLWK